MIAFQFEPDATRATRDMVAQLTQALEQGEKVLWLVCGGSNIPLIVDAMAALPSEKTANLTICLTDERYGKPGHPDSNWTQLDAAGFNGQHARIIPTLIAGKTLEDTCTAYGQAVTAAMNEAGLVVAQFGIGGDGHIAGILPNSPAVGSTEPVIGYDAGAFTRVTLTPPMLRRIQSAYALAYGDTKRRALEQLRDRDLPLDDQPAQILKELGDAHVYSDQLAA